MRALSSRLLVVAAALGLASSAGASPILYTMVGGPSCTGPILNCVTITATGPNGTLFNAAIGLTGDKLTFDDTGHAFPSFHFTAGPTAPLPATGDFAGVNIALNSLSILQGTGYTQYFVGGPLLGGAGTYPFTVGPIAASGSITLSGNVNLGPLAFNNSTAAPTLSGQIQLNGGLTQLSLNGITIGVLHVGAGGIPGTTFPTTGGDITIKADVIFTAVPEPGTALLLGGGLAGIASALRRRARD